MSIHAMPATDDSGYGYCSLHERSACTLCDECGHEGALHLNAHEQQATSHEAARYIFERATCWAENICTTCAPELYAEASAMLEAAAAEAGRLEGEYGESEAQA